MSSALTVTLALFSTRQCWFTAVVRLWSVSDNCICNILMTLAKIHHHPSALLLRSQTIFPVNQHPAKFSSGAPSPLLQIKKPWQYCPYLLVLWDGVCFLQQLPTWCQEFLLWCWNISITSNPLFKEVFDKTNNKQTNTGVVCNSPPSWDGCQGLLCLLLYYSLDFFKLQ